MTNKSLFNQWSFYVIDENKEIPKDVDFTNLMPMLSDFQILRSRCYYKYQRVFFS